MPVVTNDDVWSGVKGLTVVLLQRKVATPAKETIAPNDVKVTATLHWPGNNIGAGTTKAITPMTAAKISTTTKGGIRSSSQSMRMILMRL